jgi:hypothetical protein
MELVYCKKVDATQAVALQLVEKLSAVFRLGGGVFTVHAFTNLERCIRMHKLHKRWKELSHAHFVSIIALSSGRVW